MAPDGSCEVSVSVLLHLDLSLPLFRAGTFASGAFLPYSTPMACLFAASATTPLGRWRAACTIGGLCMCLTIQSELGFGVCGENGSGRASNDFVVSMNQ